jgi:hypothetical protein
VSISLKHSDDAHLRRALGRFQELCRSALRDADQDAEAFAGWLEDRSAVSIGRLLEAEEHMARSIEALLATIGEIEPFVRANMVGDLTAAKSLAHAARAIQQANAAETMSQRRAGKP